MSELIDKQAAIDAMQKLIITDDEEGLMLMEYNQAVTDCIDKVAELPPVEQKGESMTVEEYRRRMMDAFHNSGADELIALVVLPTEKEFEHLEWLLKEFWNKGDQKRWIPVSERLPEKDGDYLVTVKGMRNYIKCCYFALNLYKVDKYDFENKKGVAGFYEYDSEYGYYEMTEVIAWCELPEPYKMCGGEQNE